ncbi:MAG: response regulator transcription factor [Acidobacteriota bacterium]|nr:response regulator transcription factor [Acidobacteriota bacterium]MDH3522506.1 response regulator transcription factor [Acidobacteriota bacterium]
MRILIADDHTLFRDSLRSLLEARDQEVVGEADNGAAAIKLAWDLKPDLVLMDLLMPEMDGLEATKRLVAELPEVKVVILTASEEDAHLFEAIKSGAKGYLTKNLESDQFFTLLDGVGRGEPALSAVLARKLLEEFARPRAAKDFDPDALTGREQDVLELMVEGTTSNRELAESLGVTENTVKFHVRNILDKLHLHNRAQVVGYALRHHMVEPGDDSEPSA